MLHLRELLLAAAELVKVAVCVAVDLVSVTVLPRHSILLTFILTVSIENVLISRTDILLL